MPRASAWYVRAQRSAFPYGRKWVSGPFDEMDAAFAEADRLRPFYPDASLMALMRTTAGPLPAATPRAAPPETAGPSYSLSTAKGRREAADAIAERVQALGLDVTVEDWISDLDVDCSAGPFLRANIWLAHLPAAPMPCISWVGHGKRLRTVPGAWAQEYPHRKATSEPRDWAELFAMLETGLLAAIDGSAFETEGTEQ